MKRARELLERMLSELWRRLANWAWPAHVDQSIGEDGEPHS